jgi:general secretion pathway protein G
MKRRSEQYAATRQRGDTIKVVRLNGHRVVMSGRAAATSKGFTLIELVISITVMTILTLGIVPLVKVSVKRQRELQLRDTLRAIRSAIDEFHRDTVGMTCPGTVGSGGGPVPPIDPRSKVYISDCTIFGVDNIDRYPPDLQTLVDGVNVMPRVPNTGGNGLGNGNSDKTTLGQVSTKKKVYLRALPIDPLTGKAEWDFRSCYDAPDSDSWGGENLFDIRSKSKGTALNGDKYSDW